MLDNLKKYHILLASKSPRRRELLSDMRIPFNTISIGGLDESYPDTLNVLDIPQYLSDKKANAYQDIIRTNEMVITADTLVIQGDKVFGKPEDGQQAAEMLRQLSGHTHKVVTGVTISTADKRTSFTSVTEVTFAELSDEDISFYIENYAPLDKAGAYGIQEWLGCIAVSSIKGSFYNVMGLPLHRLYQELKLF